VNAPKKIMRALLRRRHFEVRRLDAGRVDLFEHGLHAPSLPLASSPWKSNNTEWLEFA
jgi:hypothetical protein